MIGLTQIVKVSTPLRPDDYHFPGRIQNSNHISTRQYARIVRKWVKVIGLDARFVFVETKWPML